MTEIERLADMIEGYCDRPQAAETIVRALLRSLRDDYTIGSANSPIRGLERASELWRGMIDHLLEEP